MCQVYWEDNTARDHVTQARKLAGIAVELTGHLWTFSVSVCIYFSVSVALCLHVSLSRCVCVSLSLSHAHTHTCTDILSVAVSVIRDRFGKKERKKADLCFNLYPCVIWYYLILSIWMLREQIVH